MKILYVATDQRVPGGTGGSVHVEEVARGLSRRGHEVHVLARPGHEEQDSAQGGEAPRDLPFEIHRPPGVVAHRALRWMARTAVGRWIETLDVDVVLERYYNFGGEGVRAAHKRRIPAVLEVNSPVMDHPGSLKAVLDGVLLLRPMRRLREAQCRQAEAIVTPLPSIVPSSVPREKVFPIHWGANVERFRPSPPSAELLESLSLAEEDRVIVFSGSFRRWHGADVVARAAKAVLRRSEAQRAYFLMIGSGPEHAAVRREIERLGIGDRFRLTGAIPYREMPRFLSLARVGVAPFQPSRHGQLQLGFYWSPLKVFEYMAMGLPVVTLDVPPLSEIIRHGKEGLLIREGDAEALAEAVCELLIQPERAEAMGRAARKRVVDHYSWQAHCERLERVLESVIAARSEEAVRSETSKEQAAIQARRHP